MLHVPTTVSPVQEQIPEIAQIHKAQIAQEQQIRLHDLPAQISLAFQFKDFQSSFR